MDSAKTTSFGSNSQQSNQINSRLLICSIVVCMTGLLACGDLIGIFLGVLRFALVYLMKWNNLARPSFPVDVCALVLSVQIPSREISLHGCVSTLFLNVYFKAHLKTSMNANVFTLQHLKTF